MLGRDRRPLCVCVRVHVEGDCINRDGDFDRVGDSEGDGVGDDDECDRGAAPQVSSEQVVVAVVLESVRVITDMAFSAVDIVVAVVVIIIPDDDDANDVDVDGAPLTMRCCVCFGRGSQAGAVCNRLSGGKGTKEGEGDPTTAAA